MATTKLLLLLLSFVPVSISVPSCVVEDPYCELDGPGVNIIQSEYGVESWNECQVGSDGREQSPARARSRLDTSVVQHFFIKS